MPDDPTIDWLGGDGVAATTAGGASAVRPSADSTDEELRRCFPHWHGGFDCLDVLGRGGFGIVFLAWQRTLRRHVAIKVLWPDLARDSRLTDLFRNEAYVMGAVRSPRIVTVHDFCDAQAPPFIWMEFVDAPSLADLLGPRLDGQRTPLAAERALAIARWTAEALRDLHAPSVEIAHRDLTPRNVMCLLDMVKLLDLGLASAAYKRRLEGGLVHPEFGPAPGFTPEYAAPEQSCGQPSGPACDWFSFGTILFEMLSGRLPFGDSPRAEYAREVHERPVRWELLPPVPRRCRDLLERCLEKEPRQRAVDAELALRLLHDDPTATAAPAPWRMRSTLPPTEGEPPCIGRDAEVGAVTALLREGTARLVVLHGAPGVGTSRLALETARRLLEEAASAGAPLCACWVPLRGVDAARGEEGVRDAIAAALIPLAAAGAVEARLTSVLDKLLDEGPTLLVLDGVDRLAPDVARVADQAVRRHPNLRIVVTAADPAPFPARTRRRVDPLPTPSPGASAQQIQVNPAAMLFAAFLRELLPGFELSEQVAPAIAALCTRLGGVPLALRMVASVGHRFDPAEMLARLDSIVAAEIDRSGPHASVDTLIRSGVAGLHPGEQRLLARLSAFRGGWSLRLAEAVCRDGDRGAPLVDGQPVWARLDWLVQRGFVQDLGDRRQDLLPLVRRLAEGMLASDGATATELRFRSALLDEVGESIVGRQPEGWNRKAWLDGLAPERENLRRLWSLCAAEPDPARRADDLATIVRGLDVLWLERGVPDYAWEWCAAALEGVELLPSPQARMSLVNAAASTAITLRRRADADRLLARARTIADSVGSTIHKLIFAANSVLNALRADDCDATLLRAAEALALAELAGLPSRVDPSGPAPCEPVLQTLVAQADALKRLGRRDEARTLLSNLVAPLTVANDQQRLHEVELALAQIALADGDRDEAAARLESAERRNRLHRGNRIEQAMETFLRAALDARPGDAGAEAGLERTWRDYVEWGGLPDRFLLELKAAALARCQGPGTDRPGPE